MQSLDLETEIVLPKQKDLGGRPPAPRPNERNLVLAWVSLQGAMLDAALDDMNEALGANHTRSRLGEWERCVRGLPSRVANYMIGDVLRARLAEHGLGSDAIDDILADVEIPTHSH